LQSVRPVRRVAELLSLAFTMKLGQIILGVLIGAVGGWLVAREQSRVALIGGPYSDNYQPALAAIAEAKSKIQSGDTNVVENLNVAQVQIEQAQQWTRRFLGQQDGAPNGNQPSRSETNSTSSAAGSRR
jgi:hypothetical protein